MKVGTVITTATALTAVGLVCGGIYLAQSTMTGALVEHEPIVEEVTAPPTAPKTLDGTVLPQYEDSGTIIDEKLSTPIE